MSETGMYSNFKSFCWQDPNIQPYLWGMEALVTFDHSNYIYPMGMIVVAIVCFMLTARTLYLTRRPYLGMSLLIGAYSIGTGLFGLARAASDFSRILLLSAASHNAPEWGIIMHMLASKSEVYKHWKRTQLWMWFVCVFTMYVPDMLASAVFEQSAGIVCDYLLLFLTWQRLFEAYRKPTDDPTREKEMSMWKKAAFGSLLHFGQIWSLVFGQGFPTKGGPALLFHVLVAGTAIPTFWLWSDFAIEFDQADYEWEEAQSAGTDTSSTNPQRAFNPYLTQSKKTVFWWFIIGISIPLALFTIVGVGQAVGFCGNKHENQTPAALAPKLETYLVIQPKSRSDKDAVKTFLEEAIAEAAEQGSSYNLLQNPDHLALLKYASKVPLDNDAVNKALHSSYFLDIARIAPSSWNPVKPDDSHEIDLAYRVTVNFNVNKLWKILANWKDASYIKGCQLQDVTKFQRRCIFTGGNYDNVQRLVSIDKRTKTLTYDIVDGYPVVHFRQTINLSGTNTTTNVHMNVNYMKRNDTDSKFDSIIKSRLEENMNWIEQKFQTATQVKVDLNGNPTN